MSQTKPTRHPALKRASVEMNLTGRIHGTGQRLTGKEWDEARRLRKKDPQTYTLRRLGAIYGLDPASMHYGLVGGREASKKRTAQRKARALASKRRAREQAKIAA